MCCSHWEIIDSKQKYNTSLPPSFSTVHIHDCIWCHWTDSREWRPAVSPQSSDLWSLISPISARTSAWLCSFESWRAEIEAIMLACEKRTVIAKRPSLHSAWSLIGQSEDRVGEVKRRLLHSDTPSKPYYPKQTSPNQKLPAITKQKHTTFFVPHALRPWKTFCFVKHAWLPSWNQLLKSYQFRNLPRLLL